MSACKSLPVDTLAERIAWILEHCRADSGEKWTAKSLSAAAGLAEAHVGMIKRGLVKNPGNDTLEAIAKKARVSYLWLGTGQGRPTDDDDRLVVDQAGGSYGELGIWPRLLVTARQLAPEIEDWVWEEVARAKILLSAPVTARVLVGVAKLVMENVPPPAIVNATKAKRQDDESRPKIR